jgi:hypothetical protein
VADRCGGAARDVASVEVATRSGARRPAALGDRAWRYVADDVPLVEDAPGGEPRTILARDRAGALLGSVRVGT